MSLGGFARVEADAARAATARPRRALALCGHRVLVDARSQELVFVTGDAAHASDDAPFLGLDESGAPLHAIVLENADDATTFERLGFDRERARFVDPRMELGRYDSPTREALLTALALARWSQSERFCGRCGARLTWEPGGRTKICDGRDGPHRHFPRTDPATIVLVCHGDRVLLGRQAAWPAGLYSTLAGFVEAGETVEASVAREVYEEVGVRVNDVRYAGSEAWPFPRSLMLGFDATATTTEIRIGEELEDARWFERAELAALQETMAERMPHFDTIARRLMRAWLEGRRDF